MISYYFRALKVNKLKTLSEFQKGSWISVVAPTEEELTQLCENYKLESGLLKDALDLFEVPRIEVENGTTYIFARVPVVKENETVTLPFLLAVGSDFVLTLSREECSIITTLTSPKTTIHTTQKIKLFLQIFLAITKTYHASLTAISRRVRSVSVNMNNVKNKDVVQFVIFENTLNDYLAALIPMNTMLNQLLSGKYMKFYEDDMDLAEDLQLANNQLVEFAKSTLKTISNIRNAYSTLMTNSLNQVIKLLTAITIVLTVPTIISSFYGMNVKLPLSEDINSFWFIVGFTLAVSFLILIIFKKKRWF